MLAQVDYLGVAALVAPFLLALFGVAYRMGQLNENVKSLQGDMTDMKRDITLIQRVMIRLPRRKTDIDDEEDDI